jgi:hypothetical protein
MPNPLIRHTLTFILICTISACQMNSGLDPKSQSLVDQRNQLIRTEPPGDYFYGRRFYISSTRFWGYLRQTGQTWDQSKLVIINETKCLSPDRKPEQANNDDLAHGYDHNYEYKVWGHYTGRKIYDPNSNMSLPEFKASRFECINNNAGWLFSPKEKYTGEVLFRYEPNSEP